MNYDFNNVPNSIRGLDQWVLWKVQTRDGKMTKVPCSIHGTPCNVQDVQNHMSFQAAIDTFHNSPAGQFSGIGFVFKEGGGLTGIDLDKCTDPDTGSIETWAEDIITSMDSYTEFSVSGTGFHIIVKGKIPGKRSRKDSIEIYDSGRFFVFTGNVFGEPQDVMERQSELNELYNQLFPEPVKRDSADKSPAVKHSGDRLNALPDNEILEKLFREPKGAKWQTLYEHGWSESLGYDSQSSADFAFACKLAFYSSDVEQIRRIFCNSALGKREKWENRADYQDGLISNALDRQVEKYSRRAKSTDMNKALENNDYNGTDGEYPEIAPFEAYSVPTFPLDIFPKWLRDYVGAVATFSQTPVDAAAMMALTSVAMAVHRRYKLEVLPGFTEPLCLYSIIALPSANRKSEVFNKMMAPIYAYEESLREEMVGAISERKAELEWLKGQKASVLADIKKGNLDARLQLEEIQKKLDSTKELFPPALIKQDITAEKLVQAMSENHNRMGVLSAEGGVLDIVAGLYSDKKTNVDIFLKGHSSEHYAYDRKNGGSVYLKSPTLSVGLLVQNDHLQRVLTNSSLNGRGLFARFLYAIPDSPLGTRKARSTPISPAVREMYHEMMTRLLKRKPLPPADTSSQASLSDYVKSAVQGTAYDEEEPTQTIRLSQEAIEVYERLFDKNEPRLNPDNADLTSALKAWAGKLVGQIMRIAGLLHMAEHADQEELPEEVAASTVEAAARLEEYFFAHALKAFGQASEGVHAEKQKYILQALAVVQGNDTLIKWFTRTKIWNLLKRKGYAKVAYMDKDLQELVDRNYLLVQHIERHGNGRDSTMYGLNPKAIELLNR
ncbi:phage NrS-1 polymerase family protein [Paenibacillus woosongensis]|uniref:NrS-1 polymerase-like HBD domain-containing protein n=1 Tax=Paenibacillus woosongensis TaxID=307580 RepID=A0ABQ4MT48_9BACL|nr:DUF3987 domain-containing protein [Paenibacillus woosongensis]GIP59093.1 hypothetical protein J15TS10_29070 [Paenibacillus woosongensis]